MSPNNFRKDSMRSWWWRRIFIFILNSRFSSRVIHREMVMDALAIAVAIYKYSALKMKKKINNFFSKIIRTHKFLGINNILCQIRKKEAILISYRELKNNALLVFCFSIKLLTNYPNILKKLFLSLRQSRCAPRATPFEKFQKMLRKIVRLSIIYCTFFRIFRTLRTPRKLFLFIMI